MTRLQQRELTAHFVSGWTRDRLIATLELMRTGELPVEQLVGQTASESHDIVDLMNTVTSGELRPTAAAIRWATD